MIVVKFGGTSVSNKENLQKVLWVLQQKTAPFVVVVSAFSEVTSKLDTLSEKTQLTDYESTLDLIRESHVALAKELIKASNLSYIMIFLQQAFNELEDIGKSISILGEISDKTKAKILSYGEKMSSYILHAFLEDNSVSLNLIDAAEYIKTDNNYLNAEVAIDVTYKNITSLNKKKNYITGGFFASNENDDLTLLGRGGSDYTAALFAGALDAEELEIWSDVNGMQTANPSLVNNSETIKELSYKEAFELAYFGAKVLYPPSIRPVMEKDIKIVLKNTKNPSEQGTTVSQSSFSDQVIKGVTSMSNISILNVSGVGIPRKKGFARKLFQALEEEQINIIIISQACSEQSVCVGILDADVPLATQSIEKNFRYELENKLINPIYITSNQSIVVVVGDKMKSEPGLSGKIFSVLGENGINIVAISQGSSERNISVVIDANDEKKSVNVIHENFFKQTVKKVHLFIAGIGTVGSSFVEMIRQQYHHLLTEHQIDIKIVGVINSTKMMFDSEGLGLEDVLSLATHGTSYDNITVFLEKIKSHNLRNSIFIDNTASEHVSDAYHFLLHHNVSVVTCNKIACASGYDNYEKLLETAKKRKCGFRYESVVGAGLPIIKTIHDLVISGDKIYKIEAVISGSLNFIFNHYNGKNAFSKIVEQAQKEGYTEPNPYLDLSGVDVMRKILILSREAGYHFEMKDIQFQGFLPDACVEVASSEFIKTLAQNEDHFKKLYENAEKNQKKLKAIATLENNQLKVSLKEVGVENPSYYLEGKDNIVALYTHRYQTEPLIIKGAGAGAMVTAMGVFSDVMHIIKR